MINHQLWGLRPFSDKPCGFWDASTCTKDQHGRWHLEFDPARNCRHRGESLERSWPHERHIGRHSGHPGYLGSGPMGLTFSSIARVKKSYSCGETFFLLDVAGYFGAAPSVKQVGYWWISTSLETFEMILEHVDVGRYCWISPSILPIVGDFSYWFPTSISWYCWITTSATQWPYLGPAADEKTDIQQVCSAQLAPIIASQPAMGGGFQVVMGVPGSL